MTPRHVFPFRTLVAALALGLAAALTAAGLADTLEGDDISATNVVKADVTAINGVIHVIDKVLMPGS